PLVRQNPALGAAEDEFVDRAVVVLVELAVEFAQVLVGLVAIPDGPFAIIVGHAGPDDPIFVCVPVPNAVAGLLDDRGVAGSEVDAFDRRIYPRVGLAG